MKSVLEVLEVSTLELVELESTLELVKPVSTLELVLVEPVSTL